MCNISSYGMHLLNVTYTHIAIMTNTIECCITPPPLLQTMGDLSLGIGTLNLFM